LISEARAEPNPDPALISSLRRNRALALGQRARWAESLAAVQELRAEGGELPAFVRLAEADALLALRRAAEARQAYDSVLLADPDNRSAKIGKFFALADEEDWATAFLLVDALAASEPPGVRLPGQTTVQPNDLWLDGNILAARARSFADMPAAAWGAIRPLVDGAPANPGLRTLEADLAASRGWPRLSDELVHVAASLAPEDKDVHLGLANSALRRQRWGEARTRIAELSELQPDDPALARARRDLELHDDFELESEFHYRHEKNGANTTGSSPGSGTDAALRLYSPPVGDVLRFFAAWEYHEAQVTEGLAQRWSEGLGVRASFPDLSLGAVGWQNDGDLSKPGADIDATWQPTDHWTFGAAASRFARDTPLRAVLNQISADSLSASVQYAWHESRSLRISGAQYDFSDGNLRQSLDLSLAQRVVDVPQFDLTLRPELYTSANSSDQGPYFSPLRDWSASLTLDAEHLLWREYERSFRHGLALTGGHYWQQDFDDGWTGSLSYEQTYRDDPSIELSWGVSFSSALYDGDRTPALETFVRLHWYF
jgi:biofilm PGA synthesis protein PgaA